MVKAIAVFDIDGVIRDVGGSYRRALADTVEHFTQGAFRPSMTDIDGLKAEGLWNNDWEASQELIYRYYEAQGQSRSQSTLNYDEMVGFFQRRYRGPDPENPDHWTGYICQEPLLLQPDYFNQLTQAGILWGFFSGATRGSARYVLERRLGLQSPVLIAMEDAPGKPDPTGLLETVQVLESRYAEQPGKGAIAPLPVFYAGDTVADMQTLQKARQSYPQRQWIGIGILPPHAQTTADYAIAYRATLEAAEASLVLDTVEQLTPMQIQNLL